MNLRERKKLITQAISNVAEHDLEHSISLNPRLLRLVYLLGFVCFSIFFSLPFQYVMLTWHDNKREPSVLCYHDCFCNWNWMIVKCIHTHIHTQKVTRSIQSQWRTHTYANGHTMSCVAAETVSVSLLLCVFHFIQALSCCQNMCIDKWSHCADTVMLCKYHTPFPILPLSLQFQQPAFTH